MSADDGVSYGDNLSQEAQRLLLDVIESCLPDEDVLDAANCRFVHEPPGIRPQHVIVRPPCGRSGGHFQRFDLRGDLLADATRGVVNNLVLKNSLQCGFG